MKNSLQKILTCSLFSLSIVFSGHALVAEHKQPNPDLDYFKSRKIDLNLGVINIRVNFELGHDKLFKGFNEEGINLTFGQGLKQKQTDSKQGSLEDRIGSLNLGDFTKVLAVNVAKNEIKKYLENNKIDELLNGLPPYAKWFISRIIKNGKLTPTDVFILKTYMLYVTDLGVGYENLKTVEFLILVIKLINSSVNFDINKINSLIEKLSEYFEPEFISFVRDLVNDFKTGFKNIDFENIKLKNSENKQQVLGYAFDNNDAAQAFYDRVKSVSNLNTEVFKSLAKSFTQSYDANTKHDIFDKVDTQNLENQIVLVKDLDPNLVKDKANGVYLDSSDDKNTVYCVNNNKENNLDYALLTKSVVAAIYHAISEYKEISGFEFNDIIKSFNSKELENNLGTLNKEKAKLQNKLDIINKNIAYNQKNIEHELSTPWFVRTFNRMFKNSTLNSDKVSLLDYEKVKQETEQELTIISNKLDKLNIIVTGQYSQNFLNTVKDKTLIETFKTIFSFDNNFTKILKDILTDNNYKIVRENLFNRLAAVSGNFELVKEYWPTIEYVLENKFPELKENISTFSKKLEEEPGLETSLLKLSLK